MQITFTAAPLLYSSVKGYKMQGYEETKGFPLGQTTINEINIPVAAPKHSEITLSKTEIEQATTVCLGSSFQK